MNVANDLDTNCFIANTDTDMLKSITIGAHEDALKKTILTLCQANHNLKCKKEANKCIF